MSDRQVSTADPRRLASPTARAVVVPSRTAHHPGSLVYECRVVEVREKMIGGRMSCQKLEGLLNEHARQEWRLKAITSAEVEGRIGPGGVEGLLLTSERVE